MGSGDAFHGFGSEIEMGGVTSPDDRSGWGGAAKGILSGQPGTRQGRCAGWSQRDLDAMEMRMR